jgi:hypothetical protein
VGLSDLGDRSTAEKGNEVTVQHIAVDRQGIRPQIRAFVNPGVRVVSECDLAIVGVQPEVIVNLSLEMIE